NEHGGPQEGPRVRAGRQPGGPSRPGISAAAQLVVSDSRSRTMIASPPRASARPAQKRRPVTLEPVLASGWAATARRLKLSPRTLVFTVVVTPATAVVVVDATVVVVVPHSPVVVVVLSHGAVVVVVSGTVRSEE